MGHPFFIPLRITMAVAFAITVLATSALIGIATYQAAIEALRESIRVRLKDITSLAVAHVDAAAVARLQKPEDKNTPEYAAVKASLARLKETSPDIRFAYLYRIEPSGRVYFVADNEPEDSKDISHLGDEYTELPELGRTQYQRRAKAVTEKEFTQDRWGSYLSSYVPILNAEGQVECALGIDMAAEAVKTYEHNFLQNVIGVTFLATAIVLAGSVWYSRRISRPLLKIADDLGRVQRLELDHELRVDSVVREVILMRDAVSKLKSSLRSFRKYVPADLVTDLMAIGHEARLGAERREITIFFSDIVGFSGISEKLTPEQLVDDMSTYFAGMTRAILDTGGAVDKYIGDAIMAFWGAPHPTKNHAVQACRAALRCRDHSMIVADQQQSEGKMPMFTRIGVHTGVALIGNIGFEARLNYTAMGDMVNLGSRLEGLNKYYGTQILISEETYRSAREAIEARFIDLVAVKGKSIAVRVYELVCARGDLPPAQATLIAAYERAMELYLGREFEAAAEAFRKLAESHPKDEPTLVMLNRCRAFISDPPEPEWAGEFVMESK